jgi:methyltransferase (TIGR00027 family)
MAQVIQNVSDTAFMVAGFRALETERRDPLFRDPLAAKLAGDHGRRILAGLPRRFVGGWSVVVRTVIIDELIKQAIGEGVDTVLNLGAGLDTRPYRMDLPHSLRWVEVDYPHVIELKETHLADEEPRCRLERTDLDLTDRTARRRFLADMNAYANKILVLTEGVAPYLAEDDVAELTADLRGTEKVRFWIIDYFSPHAIRVGEQVRRRFMRETPFRFTPDDWFAFFDRLGWNASEIRYIAEEADRLGRPIELPFLWRMRLRMMAAFASSARRQQFKRFAAYVLLTPK